MQAKDVQAQALEEREASKEKIAKKKQQDGDECKGQGMKLAVGKKKLGMKATL